MRALAVLAIVTLWWFPPSNLQGQTLTLDPAKPKQAEFVQGTRKETIESGDEVRVSSPYNLTVRVTGQNNAFYTCKLSTEELDVPEVKALQQFLGASGPYLLEVGQLAAGTNDRRVNFSAPRRGGARVFDDIDRRLAMAESATSELLRTIAALEARPPVQAARALEAELDELDKLIWSEQGIHAVHLNTLATLETMSRSPQVDTALRNQFRRRAQLACADGKCQELSLVRALLVRYSALQARYLALDEPSEIEEAKASLSQLATAYASLRDLRNQVSLMQVEIDPESTGRDANSRRVATLVQAASTPALSRTSVPDPQKLSEAAKKALSESGSVVNSAYHTQTLALRAANAESDWECDAVGFDWDKGRTVTVNITPRSEPELARLARVAPITFKTEVQPRWFVSPSVGLSLLYAPGAEFPKYDGKDVEGGKEIVDSGTQDNRLTYGLTLGLSWPLLQDRLPSDTRVYAPEITINPSEDIRAFGVGGGISWRVFKIGAGWLWTKHSALDGQSLGQVVPALKTRDRYGRSHYFSFSLVGWPPFLKSD